MRQVNDSNIKCSISSLRRLIQASCILIGNKVVFDKGDDPQHRQSRVLFQNAHAIRKQIRVPAEFIDDQSANQAHFTNTAPAIADVDGDGTSEIIMLGSVQNALISGVMMQWILDPERAPSGADVAAGLRALAHLISPAEGADCPAPCS